jgi:hypothetical protein
MSNEETKETMPVGSAEEIPAKDQETPKEESAFEKDKEAYVQLEKCMNDNGFSYLLACKRYGNESQTSLLVNRGYKMTTAMKLFIQMSLVNTISSISQDIAASFNKDSLIIGPQSNFFSVEKLSKLIEEKISELEEEGKIIIIDNKDEETAKKLMDEADKINRGVYDNSKTASSDN